MNTTNISPFDEQNTNDASGQGNKKKKKKKRYNPYGSGTANPENMQPSKP